MKDHTVSTPSVYGATEDVETVAFLTQNMDRSTAANSMNTGKVHFIVSAMWKETLWKAFAVFVWFATAICAGIYVVETHREMTDEVSTLKEETRAEVSALKEETRAEVSALKEETSAKVAALKEALQGLEEHHTLLQSKLDTLQNKESDLSQREFADHIKDEADTKVLKAEVESQQSKQLTSLKSDLIAELNKERGEKKRGWDILVHTVDRVSAIETNIAGYKSDLLSMKQDLAATTNNTGLNSISLSTFIDKLSNARETLGNTVDRISKLEADLAGYKANASNANAFLEQRVEALEQVQYQTGIVYISHAKYPKLWNGTGIREVTMEVKFEKPFLNMPHVSIGGLWQLDSTANVRFKRRIADIRKDGFSFILGTWGDTKISTITVEWVATDVGMAVH